jgi:hypothetical protein
MLMFCFWCEPFFFALQNSKRYALTLSRRYMHKYGIKGECLLMLTDGYIPNQEPSNWQIDMPVLWCVKGNSRFNDTKVVGKVVHVE